MTWLHDLDTLRSLSDESGPVAHWARLQRLARGDTAPAPLDEATAGAGLALHPTLAGEVIAAHPAELGWVVHHAIRQLGLAPGPTEDWVSPLARHLPTPDGAAAANTLTLLDSLTRPHLVSVLAHAKTDACLPAWVLATTEPEQLTATAQGIAADLRADVTAGSPVLLSMLPLLVPNHPERFPQDGLEAAQFGAFLAGEKLETHAIRGSARAIGYRLLRQLAPQVPGPAGALALALGTLEKAAPLHPGVLAAVSWAAHFESTGDPVADVRDRGSRRPQDLKAYRESLATPPDTVTTPLEALACLPFLDDETVARTLLSSEAVDLGAFWARQAAAARHPQLVVAMLADPERRNDALTLASFGPCEAMLDTLLHMAVPADPEARAYFGEAMLRMGVPIVIPTVRALLPHLDPADIPELERLCMSLFNQPLS